MPNMRVCNRTGALIFTPTKQEKEIEDLKNQLRKEIQEVQEIKKDFLKHLGRDTVADN
jgi:hypothetical protein